MNCCEKPFAKVDPESGKLVEITKAEAKLYSLVILQLLLKKLKK